MSVTVILAALDEAANIGPVVRGCLPHVDEVLVVDDGSTDDTAAIAARAGARVISLSRNRGKGVAVRRGAIEASGDVLVFMDADGQDDPEDLPVLLLALERADMVIGSRFMGRFEADAITPLHAWGNKALTRLVNVLFGAHLTDTQAGFRAIGRERFLSADVAATGYDVEVDLVTSILRAGGRIIEVPVTRRARTSGRSHLRTVRDGSRIALRIGWRRLRA
ncbi:MAG: glycosyltransferase family 2 protein [Nannocystaceae bacterium]|nr:glycosyltransferase family 2 protein [bacterium]